MFKWFRRGTQQTEPGAEPVGASGSDDAVKWFRKAAEKGTSWGQYNLGVSYARGVGLPQDYSQAIEWFSRAAAQGEPMSQYSLGQMYDKGLGVAPDPVEAYKWYQLAATHGMPDAEKARGILRRSLTPEQIA